MENNHTGGRMTPRKEVIQVINTSTFLGKEIDVYGSAEEPLFLAKDVAEWIGISNPSDLVERVDKEERSKFNLGRQGFAWFLTENGLYETLMQSRKPLAKQFKKGVKQILKDIRRHGGYISEKECDTPEEILARAVIVANEALKRKEEQLRRLEQDNTNKVRIIEDSKPKVFFAETVEASKNSILINELAKIITQSGYEIGEKRLFSWLRQNGYLGQRGENYNLPAQKFMQRGLFEIKKFSIMLPDGSSIIKNTVKVTGKGQIYFLNKFNSSPVAAMR